MEQPAQLKEQGSDPLVVTNIGQIASLTLPDGFEPGPEESGTSGNNMFREYHLAEDPDVKLYFEYRGFRLSRRAAEAFASLLEKPSQSVRNEQLEELGELLSEKSNSDDFRIDLAKTQDINGKRVLIVEGRYLKHDLQARTMFIDSDGTGSAVQEVTFQAPSAKIGRYLAGGIKALESVEWNQ